MEKIEFECPACDEKNSLVLMGHDGAEFGKKCQGCETDLEILRSNNELKVKAKNSTQTKEKKDKVPADYKKYEGLPLTRGKNKKNLVSLISMLILGASLAGFMNGFFFLNLPDEYPDSDGINIEIVVKNNTSDIEDAIIIVNSEAVNQTYAGNGTYNIVLKPGRHNVEVSALGHKNSTMEIYVPVQDNNLKLVEIEQGIDGINRFVFKMEEGKGNHKLENSVYVKITQWCSGITFLFAALGAWGAWVTYTLKSYKNAQIGAVFSILSMGLLFVGPILGFIALILLPKIKDQFNRSL